MVLLNADSGVHLLCCLASTFNTAVDLQTAHLVSSSTCYQNCEAVTHVKTEGSRMLQVLIFHFLAFIIGYFMTRASTSGADAIPVARCLSLETGMQVCLSCMCALRNNVQRNVL